MNPFDCLRAQLDRICDLLTRDIDAAGREVERYLDMEERVLYPRVDDLLGSRGVEVESAIERHYEMLAALQHLEGAEPQDRPAGAERLADLLRNHVELSDREIFRRLRLEVDEDDFQNLGDALEEARLSSEEADVELPPPLAARGADSR